MISVLTPYYKEDVLYSEDELNKENEDGISTLFYLQKIYPGLNNFKIRVFSLFYNQLLDNLHCCFIIISDEWNNFLQKHNIKNENELKENMDFVRQWVSYRGQTLTRTGIQVSLVFIINNIFFESN